MAPKVREDTAEFVPTEKEPAAVTQYIVTTDHPEFTGTIMGVQITRGRGLLNAQSIDPRLGRSFEQVVGELSRQPGYHITPA